MFRERRGRFASSDRQQKTEFRGSALEPQDLARHQTRCIIFARRKLASSVDNRVCGSGDRWRARARTSRKRPTEQLRFLEVFDADKKRPEPRERARLDRESGRLGMVQSSKRETQQMISTLGVLNEIMWSFCPPIVLR